MKNQRNIYHLVFRRRSPILPPIYWKVLMSIIFIVTSCKKFVDVPPPVTEQVTTNVFNSDNSAIAAQLSLYAQLYNWPWNLHRETALSSDEMTNYATDQTSKDTYLNSLNAANDASSLQIWSKAYNLIYQENAVLSNLATSNGITAAVKQQLIGEAHFIRGYLYFYLTNFYKNVPLVLSTDYSVNSGVSNTPQAQVYGQIISDIQQAQNLLSTNYLDATTLAVTTDKVRPTKMAATALLARTYLYYASLGNTGYFSKADSAATAVIGNSAFSLVSLSSVFLKNSGEAIWQILPQSTASYTTEGQAFFLNASPGSGLNNSATISPQLLSAFETGDQRKTTWMGQYQTYYFPYKYKDNATSSPNSGEYTMMLRLAEQYLIRAEAEVQEGNSVNALNDLNAIRKRAGLGNYVGATDNASLLAAIAHERQVELFCEGDRWLDLKRTKTIDAVMSVVTPQKGGGSWNSIQQLYPIPVTDIQNGSILQNPGY